jgi:uncharacterized phage-associated protein
MAHKVRAIDTADYILKRLGPMSAMKLQKLVYYSQVWTVVWTDNELFSDPIEAWADGPVVRSLYEKHRGHFRIGKGFFGGDTERISEEQKQILKKVLSFYGGKDAQWLSNLTHMEAPWKNARVGLSPGDRGSNVISIESIASYYSSL